MRRLGVALKMLFQIGFEPLVLYAAYRLGLRTGHYRRMDDRLLADAARAQTAPREILALPAASTLSSGLSRSARAATIREANAVVDGRVRLFGSGRIRWRMAPGRPLLHWTAYELDPALVSPFLAEPRDIKYLWEPARFGWAFSLGRAFHLTHAEKYARSFWSMFTRFHRSNPAYMGPHWMNGQEVAIRLMALVWSAHVFCSARASTPRRLAVLHRSIAEHAARIPPTLLYARSQNNNHLVAEAAALYLAGAIFDYQAWLELGWRWLNRALQRQISPQGEYIQHSTNYHRLMLQAVLLADAARRTRGEAWPARTQEALARASHWLFALLDPESGRVPNLGANDGANVLPLASGPFEDYRPTVQAAARAFLRTSLPDGDWNEMSLWLGLPRASYTADASAYAGEHLRAPNSWAYLRASSFKSRLGHMDQLHLDLWWRGKNLAADAGTYLYNAAPPWDNPLVGSRVHNTVTVDGRDQMTRAGRFLVLDWFPAWARTVLASDPAVSGQQAAEHHGYDRFGVRHARTVQFLGRGRWQVRDDLTCRDRRGHGLRLHWLLLDGEWRLKARGPLVELRIRLPRGWLTVTIACTGDAAPRLLLVRAGKVLRGSGSARPFEGWIAPTYGQKAPALSLSLEAQASDSLAFTTDFTLPD